MDRNSHSPGICQKLINFFLLRLRLPPPPASARPNGAEDPEIAVDFRHTDEHNGYYPILGRHEKDGLISGDQARLQNGSERNGFRARSGGGNGPEKTVAIKGSDHQEILVHDRRPDDHETKQRPTQHWPLRSVASNIDKKSDEFIERKKRAMGISYSLDPKS